MGCEGGLQDDATGTYGGSKDSEAFAAGRSVAAEDAVEMGVPSDYAVMSDLIQMQVVSWLKIALARLSGRIRGAKRSNGIYQASASPPAWSGVAAAQEGSLPARKPPGWHSEQTPNQSLSLA